MTRAAGRAAWNARSRIFQVSAARRGVVFRASLVELLVVVVEIILVVTSHSNQRVLVRVKCRLGARWLLVSTHGRLSESFDLHGRVMQWILLGPASFSKCFAVGFAAIFVAVLSLGQKLGRRRPRWLHRRGVHQ